MLRAACSPRRRSRSPTCRRSRVRRWTVSRCARPTPRPLDVGEAMGIVTGGVVPAGADAVIPLEYVVDAANTVEIAETVTAGANVRPQGGDLRAGDEVVEAGTRLGPAQLGALAAAGVAEVTCGSVPRAAVLATGTELRRPG